VIENGLGAVREGKGEVRLGMCSRKYAVSNVASNGQGSEWLGMA
jgi:hypothetical protein